MIFPNIPFTAVPNIFLDDMAKSLKEGELRVVLVLMRQIYGWHKQTDRISLSQISQKTGMERKSVCRSLNSLIMKGLVEKSKSGPAGSERCLYYLKVQEPKNDCIHDDDGIETDEEKEIISNNSHQCPKDTPPVSQRHPPQCPKDTPPSVLKTPTKETITKEKNIVVVGEGGGSANSSDLKYTNSSGNLMTLSESEVYYHFIKNNPDIPTHIIKIAIEKFKINTNVVNNPLKFMESLCKTLMLNDQNKPKKEHKTIKENKAPLETMQDYMKRLVKWGDAEKKLEELNGI